MKSVLCSFLFLILMTGATFGHNKEHYPGLSANNNYFIENKGQWDCNILFFTHTNGMYVWVTKDALVFDFYSIQLLPRSANFKPITPKDPVDSPIINGHVVKMKIHNNDQHIYARQEIITGQALEQYNNYFKGNDPARWASYVKLFSSVFIKNYIPGVDLKLYYDEGKFRYDLIAQPGVNPDKIALQFEGQDGLQLNDQHKLIIKTSIGDISHGGLNIYQNINGQQRAVNSSFTKISDNDIGFDLKNYNRSYPVIIDPIIFSTLLGSSSWEYGMDLEVDGSGNTILGGIVYSPNFPTTSGAYHRYTFGSYDVFITKFNSNGSSLIYSTYIGGNNVDYFYALDIDSSGNCYYTGYTSSPDYPTTSGCYQSTEAGYYYDVMVTKLNSTGSALVYSTYIGGWYGNVGLDIVIDASNNAYVCGYAYLGYPTTSGALQENIGGSWDGFVTKLNSTGSGLIYSTFLGGNSTDYCIGITIDDSDYIYLTGYTASTNFPKTTGCYQSYLNTGQDAFITKLNTTGSGLVYSTYLGGNSSVEQATDIAINSTGNACITGNTDATNFPITGSSNAYQSGSAGLGDGFITIINSTGTALLYSTYIGGNYSDYPTHIAIDKIDNVVITGYTQSTNFPTTYCALQTSASSVSDIFLCVLNPTLSTLQYSTYLGGNGGDYGTGLAITKSGDAYITGYTYSSNFPTTAGSYQSNYNGGYDAVLTKFPFTTLGMSGNISHTYCAGATFAMPCTAACNFNTANYFTVQLSNSSGSFNTPVTLGTLTSQTSGTINCNIPKNTAPGSGYRIRLVSSNPFFATTDNRFNIRINPSPTAQFTINNSTQCLGNNYFQFTNSSTLSSGSLTNLWKFGDSTFSNQTNPSHHYTYDTNYIVNLICTSDSGCSNSMSKTINIHPSPQTNFSVNDSFQCLGSNMFSFFSSTTLNKGTFTVLWNFGDGDTSTQSNPKHSFKSNSNFMVKLTAISNNGCKDSVTKTMKILPAPVALFSINDTGQCLNNNNFIFTNKTTIINGSITYLWHFGDGNTSILTNPAHGYSSPNNYTILLISTSDSGCIDSISHSIKLEPLPVAGFTVNTLTQCLNDNIFSFTNKSTINNGNLTFLWDFGDGVTDTLKNPVHSYLIDGSYTVKLIAFSSSECTDTVQSQVIVISSPKSSFTVNDSDQCFNENNFVFTNTSTLKSGYLIHQWAFGDGAIISSANATHRYNVDKIFQVKLISTSDLGCKDSTIKSIIVTSSPAANYFVTDTGRCFDNNLFSFSNNSMINTGTMHYRWFFGDSKTDTLQSPSHVYSNYGNYFVKLISTSDYNCNDTFGRIIYVYPLPAAGFTINNTVQCLNGNNFVFNNSSSIPTGKLTYNWIFGDGLKSTLTNPGHSYSNSKKYDIMLISSSLFGCSDTFSASVTVNIMPIPDFTVSSICLDVAANFSDRSFINNPDSITQWIWDFGDGSSSSDQNPTYTYITSGTFEVNLAVVSNNGCRDSVKKSFYIRPHISAPVLDRVSVRYDASDIEIEWSQPKTGYVNNFVLEKSPDNITYKVLTYPDSYSDRYIDASVIPDTMSYYYRIKAIDSCNYSSPYSNIGKSILLFTTKIKHIAEIKWSAYEEWPEGVNRYDIEIFNNNISDFVNVGSVDGNTLEYNDDNTTLNQLEYCYRVAAVRNGDEVKVYSNDDCVPVNFACFLPNTFTPNGDGLNDVLLAYGTSVITFNLVIFDRWGRRVFESNDIKIGWDGTYKGEQLPESYYYFQMSARGIKNDNVTRKGTILLARLK